jgi:hypothetical protein
MVNWKNRKKNRKSKGSNKKKESGGGVSGGSIFSPIADVDNKDRRGSKVTPGDYLLEIKNLKAGPSKKEVGVNYFAAEFKVVESEGPEALEPGTPCSWATMLKNSYAFKDVKNLVAAILCMDEDDITEAQADEAVENDGAALAGEQVVCYATENSRGYVDLYFEPLV